MTCFERECILSKSLSYLPGIRYWYQVLWIPVRGRQETYWYGDNHEQFIWYRGQFSKNVQVELGFPNRYVILVKH